MASVVVLGFGQNNLLTYKAKKCLTATPGNSQLQASIRIETKDYRYTKLEKTLRWWTMARYQIETHEVTYLTQNN
jgi:hypothetical protein